MGKMAQSQRGKMSGGHADIYSHSDGVFSTREAQRLGALGCWALVRKMKYSGHLSKGRIMSSSQVTSNSTHQQGVQNVFDGRL